MLELQKIKDVCYKHKYISICACAFLLLVFFIFFNSSDDSLDPSDYYRSSDESRKQELVVSVKEINPQDFVHKISGVNGQIDVEKTELGFEVAGIVDLINIKKGAYVKKGDILAELKGVNLFLKVRYKQNERDAAKIELKKAENTYAESKEKVETGYILERRLEDERLEVELRKNKLRAAELEFESAKENFAKIKLKAPFDGVIMEKKVGVGQNVDTSKTAFIILNTGDIYADIEINEIDSYKLRIGQKVLLNVSVESNPVNGVIEAIVPAVQGKAMILSARVKLETDSVKLLPGMFASGYILLHQEEKVFSVPIDSLLKEGNKNYIFVYEPASGQIFKREIFLGYIGDENAVVKEGLNKGESVITSGVTELKDKDKVILSSY